MNAKERAEKIICIIQLWYTMTPRFIDDVLPKVEAQITEAEREVVRKFHYARLEAETNAGDLLQLHFESGVFDDLDEDDVALIVQALAARNKAAGK